MTKLTASPAMLLLLPVFFSSCATILNGPAQSIRIATDGNIKQVSVDHSVLTDSALLNESGFTTYVVPRSRQPLVVHVQLDSVTKTIYLRSHLSPAFWLNIYFTDGIGILVDMNSPKRFDYPHWNYLSVRDTTVHRRAFAPVPKGTTRLSLAYTPVNIFSTRQPGGQYNTVSGLGAELGLDYFYQEDRYVSFSAGASTDRSLADQFGSGYIPEASTEYINIRNNYVAGRFDLGYGASFTVSRWGQYTLGDTVKMNTHLNSAGLGLALSAQYRIGNYFRAGVLYQPTLLNLGFSPAMSYHQYISIHVMWTLPLNAGGNKKKN